jgi:nucleotide-binding universal stress UspA family protein
MKILLAADGSRFTKKALGFLMANEGFTNVPNELHVLHVQAPMPPRVRRYAGKELVDHYHRDEAQKVLHPIEVFLKKHGIVFSMQWLVGNPADEIVKASKRDKAHLIVMGTHGHGLLGRVLLGSVAQRVVSECDMPVLLVK